MHASRWKYLHSKPVCMLCQYMSTGIYLPSLLWYPFQLPWIKPDIIFLFPILTTVFTSSRFVIFQAVQHMWRRYWARNRNLLNLLVGCFIFAHECVITEKSCHDISLHKNYTLPFLFLCQMFVSTSRPFHRELSCHRTFILAHNYSWCNILQQYVHIFCSMYSTFFLFFLYNL